MAQMLQDSFSSERHLNVVDRHIRLDLRTASAAFLVQDIKPVAGILREAIDATKEKEKEQLYAYDAVVFCDGLLDNEAENIFEACCKYDRESGSAPILKQVFPTGRLGDIKNAPLMQEPKYAQELLERLKALGPSHPLATFIPALQEKIAASESAVAAYDALAKEVATLVVQEEIAQRKVRDQYQLNYLHAQEKLGKAIAEMLFPVITKGSKPAETQPIPVQTIDA